LEQPFPQANRSGYREGTLASNELLVEDQERETTEMVAVQMRNDDGIDGARVEAETLEGDQRRGSTVQLHMRLRPSERDAGLESAVGAERITRADELDGHHKRDCLARS